MNKIAKNSTRLAGNADALGWLFLLLGMVIALPVQAQVQANRHALLIGISDYTHVRDLEGAVNDVLALQDALLTHWAFPRAQVATLLNQQATKARIIQEMRRLIEVSKPGDHVFIYFSGHGTSRLDLTKNWPLPYTTGALLPVDFRPRGSTQQQLAQLLVGRWDIQPLLTELDNGGRHTFVVMDACFSGNAVRGQSDIMPLPYRYIPLADSAGSERTAYQQLFKRTGARGVDRIMSNTERYPYRQVLFLSASGEHEFASEINQLMLARLPTIDGLAHGAFTDALLRVVTGEIPADTNHDARLTYSEIHRAVRLFMDKRGYAHSPRLLPVLDDSHLTIVKRNVFESTALPVLAARPTNKTSVGVKVSAALEKMTPLLASIKGLSLDEAQPDYLLRKHKDEFQLVTPAGNLVDQIPLSASQLLPQVVAQRVWATQLVQSVNTAQQFNVTLDLSGSRQGGVLIEGEKVGFSITSERSAYLLLLNVDPRGKVNVIYPSQHSELVPISAGAVLSIPLDPEQHQFEIQEPFGTEYLVAYAFEQKPVGIEQLMGVSFDLSSPLSLYLDEFLPEARQRYARAVLQLVTMQSPYH